MTNPPPYHPTARTLAYECLTRWQQGFSFAESLIEQACTEYALPAYDRKLVQALVMGVIRHGRYLDWLIKKIRQGKLDSNARTLLQMGLCQLFIMDLDPHAAVHETVSLASQHAKGLINACLRQALREKESLLQAARTCPPGIRYSTPDWLVERWTKAFGAAHALALLKWNIGIPKVYARTTAPATIPTLPESTTLAPVSDAHNWYQIHGPLPINAIQQGLIYIADPSTRHSVEVLAPQAGEHILDACAAPGGKAMAIISATKGTLRLCATDKHQHRLPALESNLARHPYLANAPTPNATTQITVQAHDWLQPCPEEWVASFDAALADVPCSNTGVIQRRVDVKTRLSPAEFTRIAQEQLQILTHVAQAVRAGGRLVYSTCSIEHDENRGLINKFLAKHPQFILERDLLVLPFQSHTDGAYTALLTHAEP